MNDNKQILVMGYDDYSLRPAEFVGAPDMSERTGFVSSGNFLAGQQRFQPTPAPINNSIQRVIDSFKTTPAKPAPNVYTPAVPSAPVMPRMDTLMPAPMPSVMPSTVPAGVPEDYTIATSFLTSMMMQMPAFAQADDQTQMLMQRSLSDKLVPEVYAMIAMAAPPNVMMSYQQNQDRIEPMLRNYLESFSRYAAFPKVGGTKVSLGPEKPAKPESKPEPKPDQAQFDKALQFVSAQINDPQGDANEYASKIVAYLNSIGEFVTDANLSKYRDKIFDILDMTDDEIQKVIDEQVGQKPKGDIMGMSYSQIFLLVIAAVAVYAIIQNMMNLVKAAVVIGAGVLLYQFIKKNYLSHEPK